MRLLFVKHSLAWPRSSGHDVYTYHAMKQCAALGHEISFAFAVAPRPEAVDGLRLAGCYRFGGGDRARAFGGRATWLQRRFRSFFGVSDGELADIAEAAAVSRADAVVVVGLDALPYFAALPRVTCVWFAADELAWHVLSQLKLDRTLFANLREAVIKAVYERSHRRLIDRAWVVSKAERRAMRWLAGVRTVDVVALGVDGELFAPGDEPIDERTAVFWGRLDFGPNIQALEWFAARVWPLVQSRVPDGKFTIIGFQPTDAVRRIATRPGVTLMPDVPDLRSAARRHALAVFPFVSGGGMKNKLLEAAALGMPIVCTPLATSGLRLPADRPLAITSTPESMADAIVSLWENDTRRKTAGAAARSWVLEHHTWTAMAREAIGTLERSQAGGSGS
jgi:glycosyltransferase involved in cell wall biosynthesis